MKVKNVKHNSIRFKPGPKALYVSVKQFIVEKIATQAWPPDFKIPSENELVKQLGVSRITINRALKELATENKLVRLQGVGTFVANAKADSNVLEIRSIADEIAARGHQHVAKVVMMEESEPAGDIARLLGIDGRVRVYHSIIVHHEEDQAVQLEDRFVNPMVIPDYLEQDFSLDTPHHYLMRIAPLTDADHIIEAIMPDDRQCRWLNISPQEPCLQVTRYSRSGDNAVSVARLLHPGSRYRLQGHIRK